MGNSLKRLSMKPGLILRLLLNMPQDGSQGLRAMIEHMYQWEEVCLHCQLKMHFRQDLMQ